MAAKILVIGATNGRFIEAFTKAAALHTKNNFSLALLLGDLFSSPDSSPAIDIQRLLRGEIKVPLPTYFGLGQHALPPSVTEKIASSGEVCENLFFLGKKTVLTTSEGVRIVALGGCLDPNLSTAPGASVVPGAEYMPFYSPTDAKGLKGANTADLLLTYEWPSGVEKGSAIPFPESTTSSVSIAELAAAIRPRYHFAAGGNVFWEREPYKNVVSEGKEEEEGVKVTRFLGLGDFGNDKGAKSLYAFSINPKDTAAAAAVPVGATQSPYREKSRKRAAGAGDGGGSFFWGEHVRDERGGKRGKGNQRERGPKPPPGPESCFFCLSYPKLEKHLIVSIGNEAYLTTAKGPLTSSSSTLPFASHILIIPLTHAPTLDLIDDAETRANTFTEMLRYKAAIGAMLQQRGYGAVTFEIARAGGVHGHWQVVPVPSEKLGATEEAFRKEVEAEGGAFERREVTEGEEYFRVWVGEEESPLVMPLAKGQYFDLQFGRRVLAKLLGLNKVHWKDCVLSLEEETEDAEKFKEAFRDYDFNLE